MRWWEELFADDREAYQSFAQQQDRGANPAVVVIDTIRSFVGSAGLSMTEAINEWPTSCGPHAHDALPAIAELLAAARACGPERVPVIHLRPCGDNARLGSAVKRGTAANPLAARAEALEFVAESLPLPHELVIMKTRASAFFDTPLSGYLRACRVDALLVAGTTTSGCVRASVVDAFSYGFAPFVVEQAVFDRSDLSAGVSLFEMNAKYADVIQLADATRWLTRLATA